MGAKKEQEPKVKKVKIVKTSLTIAEAFTLKQLLGKCNNQIQNFRDAVAITECLNIQRSLKKATIDYAEESKEIFEAFEVEKNELGNYDMQSLEKEVKIKINAAHKALQEKSYEIKGLNSISQSDFIILTAGLSFSEIGDIEEFLVSN